MIPTVSSVYIPLPRAGGSDRTFRSPGESDPSGGTVEKRDRLQNRGGFVRCLPRLLSPRRTIKRAAHFARDQTVDHRPWVVVRRRDPEKSERIVDRSMIGSGNSLITR